MNITCDVPFRHKAEIAILSSVHNSIDDGDNVKIITKVKQKISIYYTYLNSLDSNSIINKLSQSFYTSMMTMYGGYIVRKSGNKELSA